MKIASQLHSKFLSHNFRSASLDTSRIMDSIANKCPKCASGPRTPTGDSVLKKPGKAYTITAIDRTPANFTYCYVLAKLPSDHELMVNPPNSFSYA